jgi:uncharacterized membrane protein
MVVYITDIHSLALIIVLSFAFLRIRIIQSTFLLLNGFKLNKVSMQKMNKTGQQMQNVQIS